MNVVIPIAIREDLIVRIQGIPHDLSVTEAQKISAVVMALAAPVPNPGERDADDIL